MDVDVKRLAALDMHGSRGTMRRRRIILVEFTAGAIASLALAAWLIVSAPTTAGRVVGVWVLGLGLNYVVLTVYAVALSRPGALDAELAGVDTLPELRRYTLLQFWVLIPLSMVIFAARSPARRP